MFGQTNEDRDLCCPMPQGVIVELKQSIDENRSRDYNIAGHVFKLTRHSDTKAHKVYTLMLPPDL